jgi:hypothetical protein
MAALIEEERLDVDGQPIKHHGSRRKSKRKRKSKCTTITANDVEDEGDDDFLDSDSEHTSTGSESDDSGIKEIPNDEVRWHWHPLHHI